MEALNICSNSTNHAAHDMQLLYVFLDVFRLFQSSCLSVSFWIHSCEEPLLSKSNVDLPRRGHHTVGGVLNLIT
jgi:hypothetical protein